MNEKFMNEKLLSLRDEYSNLEIPEELDMVVKQALKSDKTTKRRGKLLRNLLVATAAASCLFAVAINTVPAFAMSMENVPVLNTIVRVLSFTHFEASSEKQLYDVSIDVPEIQGLDNTSLQDSLNQKYLGEGMALFESFMEEIGSLEDGQLAHRALEAGYKIKVKGDDLLTIEHFVLEIGASGAESVTYDTIDLKNQVLITLPSLFKDDSYIGIIGDNIREQMEAEMADDTGKVYFPEEFDQIAADQSFYINENKKLMIVFNEYEVAPGCMG